MFTLGLLSRRALRVGEQIFDQWPFFLLKVENLATPKISEKTRKQAAINGKLALNFSLRLDTDR